MCSISDPYLGVPLALQEAVGALPSVFEAAVLGCSGAAPAHSMLACDSISQTRRPLSTSLALFISLPLSLSLSLFRSLCLTHSCLPSIHLLGRCQAVDRLQCTGMSLLQDTPPSASFGSQGSATPSVYSEQTLAVLLRPRFGGTPSGRVWQETPSIEPHDVKAALVLTVPGSV